MPASLRGRNIKLPEVGSLTGGDELEVIGWVVGRASRAIEVKVFHASDLLTSVAVKRARPDLGAAFPEVAGADASDFRLLVDLADLPQSRVSSWRSGLDSGEAEGPTSCSRSGVRESATGRPGAVNRGSDCRGRDGSQQDRFSGVQIRGDSKLCLYRDGC